MESIVSYVKSFICASEQVTDESTESIESTVVTEQTVQISQPIEFNGNPPVIHGVSAARRNHPYDNTTSNFRDVILNDKNYYHELINHDAMPSTFAPNRRVVFKLLNYNSFCSSPMLALYFNSASVTDMVNRRCELRPRDFIESIMLQIGDTIIDKLYAEQLEILYDLYKMQTFKVVDYYNQETKSTDIAMFIPIPFDLFVGKNLFPINGCTVLFEVKLANYSKYSNDFVQDMKFKADYFTITSLVNLVRDKSTNAVDYKFDNSKSNSYNLPMLQQSFTGEETIHMSGDTKYRYKCNFNHHMSLIYFFIMDKNKNLVRHKNLVKKAIVQLNGHNSYEFDTAELAYNSSVLLPNNDYVYCLPLVPLSDLSSSIQSDQRNTVNFTFIDNSSLYLHLSTSFNVPDEYRIYVYGLAKNAYITEKGVGAVKYIN